MATGTRATAEVQRIREWKQIQLDWQLGRGATKHEHSLHCHNYTLAEFEMSTFPTHLDSRYSIKGGLKCLEPCHRHVDLATTDPEAQPLPK